MSLSVPSVRTLRACLFVVLGLLSATPALAQRDLTNIPTPDPEEELKSFHVAEGLEVSLFAADPAIHKPIQMNFDADGRLWIAASEVYPQIAPGQTANDKILILADTNHDGVADQTTVFAEGLLIPTGVLPGDGGAYVANSTELLHLKDTDGDGKADQSRIVLSGFGTEDTHHIIHTFRWGPDTRFYFNQSIYIHSHVETPYGVKRLNAGGIWQFRPETLELSVLARGWVNTWGHQFDRYGQSFVTDGAGGEGINYLVPGASYATAYGAERVLQGLNPGSPKYCGLEIVDGPHVPDDWQGNLVTHDFRGHRVCRFQVSDAGSGYISRQLPDLISTDHVAFRPIDVAQGRDGAIYIADWYNPIIQHGEVDFRDPRRDHTHGRIWRVTFKGRDLVPVAKPLSQQSSAELLTQLVAPQSFQRLHAKRILKERANAGEPVGDAARARLAKIVGTPNGIGPESNGPVDEERLELAWLLLGLNQPHPGVVEQLFASENGAVRAAAIRLLTDWHGAMGDRAQTMLASAVKDDYPRVRLEAVRVLAQMPSRASAELALQVLDRPMDQFLDYALWQTTRELQAHWLPAVVDGSCDFDDHVERLIFAVRSANAVSAIPRCVKWLQERTIAPQHQSELLTLIGTLGGPEELRLVYDLALKAETPGAHCTQLLQSLVNAFQQRQIKPAGDLETIAGLLDSLEEGVRQAALECIGVWKLVRLEEQVLAQLHAPQSSRMVQRAALAALSQLDTPSALAVLVKLAEAADSEPVAEDVRTQAIELLIGKSDARAMSFAVRFLQSTPTVGAQNSIVNGVLQRQEGTAALAAALTDQTLPADVAKIALRAVTGSGRSEPTLVEALTKAGGITGQGLMLSPEEFAQVVQAVREHGDAARGEALFRRADLACFKCHAIGGAGGKVGPDLVSIGASAQVDYLLDSLVSPSKNVKEGYQTVVLQLDDGRVISGIKLRESGSDLFVRDANDQELQIPLSSIEEQANGGSLMPVGLVDQLTRDELIDLVRFLSELGKVGPYAVSPQRLARRWNALVPNPDTYTRLFRTSDTQVVLNPAGLVWQPHFSTVSGVLPIEELPRFDMGQRLAEKGRSISFVQTNLAVTAGGPAVLAFENSDGLTLWLDGVPLTPSHEVPVELSVGTHVLTVCVDRHVRSVPLKIELRDVPGSTAAVNFASP